MPCDSSYMEPTRAEKNSRDVLTFLKEVGQPTGKFDDYYGRPKTLDADVAKLCDWCSEHREKVKNYSLELQIWWRDHQKADQARVARETAAAKRNKLRKAAFAKLTPEERKAIRNR